MLMKLPKNMTGFSIAGEELKVKKTKAGHFVDVPDEHAPTAADHGLIGADEAEAAEPESA